MFGVLADALTEEAGLVTGFVHRDGSGLDGTEGAVMMQTVPFVLFMRLRVLAWFDLYRAILRHAEALELVKFVTAVIAGRLLIYTGMAAYFGAGSVACGVIVID